MQRRTCSCLAPGALALALLAGCGTSGSGGFAVVQVTAITTPFPAGVSTPFTVTGQGFANLLGTQAVVRFTADAGTPFAGGTSATADVPGTIQNDTQVTGMSPLAGGATNFNAFVTVILPSGASGTSATAIAVFIAQPPNAVDDAYPATGNVLLTVNAASGVLANDTPGGLTVSAFDATSVNGGDVVMAANGSFTFNPPRGYEGTDTFTYTASNGALTDVATVTITITSMVWFIDTNQAVAGDGRFTDPFNSVADFSFLQGASPDQPNIGDTIFLYFDAGGPIPGNIALLPSQKLIGQGVDLVVNATVLVPASTRPQLHAMMGHALMINTNNTVRGLNLSTNNGAGIVGTVFGTLTVDEVTISAGGAALALHTGTLAATFTALTATSGASKGLYLASVSGSFTSNGTTISSTGPQCVHIENSPGTFTFNGLTLSSNVSRGLHVTNSGTLIVTGTNNSIQTQAGVPLEVTGTGIGAAGLTFRSLSSSGAANGIVLTNTTGTGGLTVTGDGTGAMNASGGTLANSTGTAIVLTSTHDVSLTQLNVNGAGGFGIDAQSVRNLTFQDGQVLSAGNANEEHSIGLQNLFGTSLIEDVVLDNINESGVAIRNDTTDDMTSDALVVRRLEVQDHTAGGFAEHGVDVQAEGTSNFAVTVDDCVFTTNANGILGVLGTSTGTSTLSLTVMDSTFNAGLAFGSGGIQLDAAGTSTATFKVLGSTVLNSLFTPVIANNDDDATSFVTIQGNTLDQGVVLNNGFGIQVRQDGNGTATVLVDANDITNSAFDGVRAFARDSTDSTGLLNLTVSDNTVGTPTIFGAGIFVSCNDLNTVRTSIFGNTVSGTGTFPPDDEDIYVNEIAGTLGVTQLAPTMAANVNELDDANNGASVGIGGTPTFNAGSTPTPP